MFGEVVERVGAATDAALLARLRALDEERRRNEAETAVVLQQLDDRKTYRDDEHASMWGLLRAEVHWSDAECKNRMRVARLITRFPDVGERLHDGHVSVAGVVEIARAAANPRIGDLIDPEIGYFTSLAERGEYDVVCRKVRSWEQRADTKAAHERTTSADEARDAHWTAGDNDGELAVQWGPVDALANREILDQYLDAEWLTDWEWTVERYGDDAATHLMPRTPAQRRADAVTAALRDAASTPPGSKAPEPVTNIIVDHDSYRDMLIEASLLPERNRDPFADPQPVHESARVCHSGHGDPIDPLTVLQLMIDGYIRYVIVNDQGVPIQWGRKRRLFEGAARDAVRSMFPRCTHPGCRVRTKRTHTDHTLDYAKGGTTDPANGNPRCRRHNQAKNHGYTVHRDALGEWHTYRPDGTEIG
ncbi:MAG: DUF222 domain-containing protein [Ilumatobacteraceae bacterium]